MRWRGEGSSRSCQVDQPHGIAAGVNKGDSGKFFCKTRGRGRPNMAPPNHPRVKTTGDA